MKVETLDAVLRLDVDEGEPVRDIGRYAIKEGKCVSRRFVELGIMGYLQSWWMDEWAEESGNNGRFGVATTPEIPGMLGHVSLTKDVACIGFRPGCQAGALCNERNAMQFCASRLQLAKVRELTECEWHNSILHSKPTPHTSWF